MLKFPFLLLIPLALLVPFVPTPLPAQQAKGIKLNHLPFNTTADEDEPHVADNSQVCYYTSNQEKKEDICFVRRKNNTLAWPKKGKVIEDYVSTRADDRSVYATQGSYPHYLFFATKKDDKARNFDLYVAVKQSRTAAWSAVTPVMRVNSEADELHPWISGDGKSLYFSRKTDKGWRVMVAKRTGKAGPGGWQEPEEVDLPVGFHHATLTPDGKTMVVQGPLEKGRWGLFVSRLTGSTWSKPVPIEELNHKEGKVGSRSPNFSRVGGLLFFASDRPGTRGGLDIWYVSTSEVLKKK